jgi:acyl dehydratase
MGEDALRERLLARLGEPMGGGGPSVAPDPVNLPMIRHWVDALDDRNPVYLDEDAAAASRFGEIVAPPAMLQTWTMSRPRIEGIAERGGAPGDIDPDSPLALLADAGFTGTLATNSELTFHRYLRLGDHLTSKTLFDDISELKQTGLGRGYFVTWALLYTDQTGEEVGRQLFRIFRFDPTTAGTAVRSGKPEPRPEPQKLEELPPLKVDLTASVIVAGAIASRDFMPAHHDRDFARAQGAPDLFMNILTSNGYVTRYVTDWAGPRARVRTVAIRLGAPACPGHVMAFSGGVTDRRPEGEEGTGDEIVEVTLQAVTGLGQHVSGTVVLSLPPG